jgi:hypothetical protein
MWVSVSRCRCAREHTHTHMCVYVYVFVHICMYVCVRVCVCVCVFRAATFYLIPGTLIYIMNHEGSTHTHTHTHVYIVCAFMPLALYVHICVCRYVYVYVLRGRHLSIKRNLKTLIFSVCVKICARCVEHMCACVCIYACTYGGSIYICMYVNNCHVHSSHLPFLHAASRQGYPRVASLPAPGDQGTSGPVYYVCMYSIDE